MQMLKKKRILLKLWGWISLSVNLLIISLYVLEQNAKFPHSAIVLCVIPICYGAIKTYVDKGKGDISVASIVIEYICVYIITFLLALKMLSYLSSLAVLIALLIAFVAEMLVFLLIAYWHTIKR